MSRPVRSTVRHGNPTCARYGCKRPECVEAARVYKRENRKARQAGVEARVPVTRAREHLNALLRAGMPPKDIEGISGVDEKKLLRVINGGCGRIHWITEEAILGTPIPEYDWESSADCYVDALPARRRLQALGVQGFPISILSKEARMDRSVITAVRSGRRRRIRMSSMRAIKEMHDRLYDADPSDFGVPPGDLIRARGWAERQGWYPTEAWVDIDDPDCKPVLKTSRYAALVENALELINGQGYTRRTAAERMGVKLDTLEAAFKWHKKAMAKASQ